MDVDDPDGEIYLAVVDGVLQWVTTILIKADRNSHPAHIPKELKITSSLPITIDN